MRTVSLTLLLAAVAVGCTMQAPASIDTPSAVPASPAPTSIPPTPLPPTATPTATAVAPFVPFTVTTWADNVLLRSNPGYLFPQLTVLRQAASLLVLARSPGGEWLLCQTADHRVGWVFAQLVENTAGDFGQVPVTSPPSVQVLRGTVKDQRGQPISGIQFSIIRGAGADAARNDAMTDDSGVFYAFMPTEASGTWLVSYTAVSCKSNTMDANCNCVAGVCGRPDPESISIELPRSSDEALDFTWR